MKAIPGRSSGFLVMISYILGTYLYGEPYSTSSNTVVYPGYTGRYTMVLLVSLVVYYSLWIGVQLPQGRYVSYSRGYILVSLGCNIGYTPVPLIPTATPTTIVLPTAAVFLSLSYSIHWTDPLSIPTLVYTPTYSKVPTLGDGRG